MAGLFGSGSPPNYIENADFLIGSNPITGVLQVWNNASIYPLNFIRVSGAPSTGFGHPATFTISDIHFLSLIAVTAEVHNNGYFADYGWNGSSLGGAGIAWGGGGYGIGDTFSITGAHGGAGAVGQVTAEGGGFVLGFLIISPGSGYLPGDTATTIATSGGGSGLTLQNLVLGVPYNDTSEFALWNIANSGPNLVDAGYHKYWPYVYKWRPSDGTTIYFPSAGYNDELVIPGFTGNCYFYYAQMEGVLGFISPLEYQCLEFESELGDKSSVFAPEPTQRIVYPPYAGCGSTEIDCGAGPALPNIRVEIQGSFAKYQPRGDADFADMIEDIIRSGIIQTGMGLSLIQRGVNLSDFHGAIDKLIYFADEPTGGSFYYPFQQPIQAGQIICAFSRWRWGAGSSGTPSISDTPGANTWNPIMTAPSSGANCGFWYAIAGSAQPADTEQINVLANTSGGFPYENESYAWVMDPDTVAEIATATNSGGPPGVSPYLATCSITVSEPSWIAVAHTQSIGTGIPAPYPVGPLWNNLFPNALAGWPNQRSSLVLYRYVAAAGTYTVQINMNANASWQIGMVAFSQIQPSSFPKALGDIIDLPSLNVVRQQCQAYGLIGSLCMNAQKEASEWGTDLYQCSDAAAVWSGFHLKSIALSEQSFVGNGIVFISPTAGGPVAILRETDLVPSKGKNSPLIVVNRKAQPDSNNIAQIQFFDRTDNYNPETVSEPYSAGVALYGPRKEPPQYLPMLQDPAVARSILAVKVRELNLLRNVYTFQGKAGLVIIEAGDVILATDTKIGIVNLALRVTKVEETDTYDLNFTCEPFVYGCRAPQQLAVTSTAPATLSTTGDPGSVNAPPIIFEPVPRLAGQTNQPQLMFVLSGSSPNYAGCQVLVSLDGGSSYQALGICYGNAVTGYTTADWPAANDPDTADDLSVDLTESTGTLQTYDATERDSFAFPCYIAGGTACIPYELMCYDIANLTSSYHYALLATGGGTNELRRGVWGAPGPTVGIGVDHPSGSRFAFLNPASGSGIFTVAMDPSWIGKTLYFKFLAFNGFGTNIQSQSAATAYSYTPNGCPGGTQNPNNQRYTITGGALTNPTSTTIHMAQATAAFASNSVNYNARTFTIPAPSVATTYYVTVADPGQLGDTGSSTSLAAQAQTSNSLVGLPGYVYIGAITVQPASGGSQTQPGGFPIAPTSSSTVVSEGVSAIGETVAFGTGTTGSLSQTPTPASFLRLTRNGDVQDQGVDYTITGTSITLTTAALSTDIFQAFYLYASAGGGAIGETVSFSGTSGTLSHAPVPPTFLQLTRNGVVQDQGVDYTLSGTAITLSIAAGGSDVFQAFYLYSAASVGTPFEETVAFGTGTSGALSHAPNPSSFLQLTRNGIILQQGAGHDYTLSGTAITLAVAGLSTDVFTAFYFY